MHTQNRRLRRVQNRRGNQRTEHPAVGNGEGAAGHLFNGQFALLGFLAVLDDLRFHFRQAFLVRIAKHRHNQPPLGGDCHTHVVVTVINNVFTVDGGVHRREAFQGFHTGTGKEPHKAETHVMGFLEFRLIMLAHIHDRFHVDLVEGGQHGRILLGRHQALGNPLAQTGHWHPTLFTLTRCSRYVQSRRLLRRRLAGTFLRFLSDDLFHITLGNAATTACAFHLVCGDTMLAHQLTGRRARLIAGTVIVVSRLGLRVRFFFLLVVLLVRRVIITLCLCRLLIALAGTAAGPFIEGAQYLLAFYGFTLGRHDLADHAIGRCHHFKHNLVGFNIDQQLITLHRFTFLFVPGGYGAVCY